MSFKLSAIMARKKWIYALTAIALIFILKDQAHATIYFSETSESRTCNASIPWYWEVTQGFYRCDGDAYAGSKYLDWHVAYHAIDAYVGIDFTSADITGKTIYMALYFKIKRVGGVNVWHNDSDQSYDKFFEFRGAGVRWIYKIGKHEAGCQSGLNGANSFTMWLGTDQTYNPGIECVDGYMQNANGYSGSNPYQISYDKWHAAVMEVKIGTGPSGYIRGYIDGVKTVEYLNIKTANGTPTLSSTLFNGTIAQPAYDTPEHYRRYDNIIITDNLQDVINGGYLGIMPSPPAMNPAQ